MSLSPQQIESELLQLDDEIRAQLLARVLSSFRRKTEDPAVARLWVEEAQRRDRAMESGDEPEIPAAEVFRHLRASLRG